MIFYIMLLIIVINTIYLIWPLCHPVTSGLNKNLLVCLSVCLSTCTHLSVISLDKGIDGSADVSGVQSGWGVCAL